MSMMQTAIGTGALAAVLSVVVNAVIPAPPAITVHSLTFDGGSVHQDRTVTGDGDAFYMAWAATVIDNSTGQAVPWCSGDGAFAYATGRRSVEMSLPLWTGAETCTPDTLPPGAYFLRATWSWGDQSAVAESDVFEVAQ